MHSYDFVRAVVESSVPIALTSDEIEKASGEDSELILFYITCIRSVLDYAVPVFYYSLPNYLIKELERIQERAMGITFPNMEYHEALSSSHIELLSTHHANICKALFDSIMTNEDHRLHSLLPSLHDSSYDLRRTRKFAIPMCKTNRLKNTFIMASCRNVNE